MGGRAAESASPVRAEAADAPSREGGAEVDLGGLAGHLGYLVRRAQLWIFQDFIRTLAPLDIRPAQYSVLVVVGANPGLSQTLLAQTLGIERARLTRLLDGLETRGALRRQPSTLDRRASLLALTPDGEALLACCREFAGRHERAVAEKMNGGRDAALAALHVFRGT